MKGDVNMKLKVSQVGNSTGVIFSKEILQRLKVKAGDEVFVTETPTGIMISAYSPDFEEQLAVAAEGMSKYKNTLRELAK
jgi:putative addiction module antidote